VKIALYSVIALILLAAAGAIGYEIGHHHSTSPGGKGHSGSAKGALTGVYVDGSAGTPHYYISLREGGKGKVRGTLNYEFQDGQTQAVLTFSGKAQDGVANLTPKIVTQSTGSASATSVPSDIAMTYDQGGITLGECTSYLHLAQSEAACSFTRSSSSNG
jgi:hypothetical protein